MLATSLALAISPSQADVDCSRDGVIYYLKQGVSADQVNKLCGSISGKNSSTQAIATMPSEESTTSVRDNDFLFFNSMIVADEVKLTKKELVLVKRDCIKYGEEVEEDVPEYACGVFKTSVQLTGLEVVSTTQGIPLIRDTELIVKGDIHRQVLNFDTLDRHTKKALHELFVANPETIDIPLRKDADPEEVGRRLKAVK